MRIRRAEYRVQGAEEFRAACCELIGLRPIPGRERTRLNDEAPPGLKNA
jgi:hypothetical protein